MNENELLPSVPRILLQYGWPGALMVLLVPFAFTNGDAFGWVLAIDSLLYVFVAPANAIAWWRRTNTALVVATGHGVPAHRLRTVRTARLLVLLLIALTPMFAFGACLLLFTVSL